MLCRFTDLLAERSRAGTALGAFTCYDLEVARAVLAAAVDRDQGVVLLVSREAFVAEGGDQLLAGVCAAAEQSKARACVQLDHVADLDLIRAAFAVGAGAVMADGSQLPYGTNRALVRAAQRAAEKVGGAVEAELGHVAGGEDVAAETAAAGYTDPEEASRFVHETGVALLAVSVGNVHGRYIGKPRLDWDRLEALERRLDVPLSLHGASGLADADLRRAVATGIRKVNFNTELRAAYLETTREEIGTALSGLRLMHLHEAQGAAVRRVAADKLALLSEAAP